VDRREFLVQVASTPLIVALPAFIPRCLAQAAMPENQNVPALLADAVYAIYSHFIATQLQPSKRKNAYSLIADRTCATPRPPIEKTVPPEFSRPVIVPSPVRWNDMQEILVNLTEHAKISYHLEDRFDFSSSSVGQTQTPPVLLLDAQGQRELTALSFPPIGYLGQPAVVRSEQEQRLIDRISRCEDLLQVGPVYFNRAVNLALLYGVDSNHDGWQDIWGVYAKVAGRWLLQGEEQGWLIVQPFGGMN
jgi:hypothetical protein